MTIHPVRRAALIYSLLLGLALPLATAIAAAPEPPMPDSLPGTYWRLLSMTRAGEKPKDSENPPDVEFSRKGEWGILHSGGRREAGTYRVTGGRLAMKDEDGALYGDYRMVWKRNERILELHDDTHVLRLRFVQPINY